MSTQASGSANTTNGSTNTTTPRAATYADLVSSHVAKAKVGLADQLDSGAKARIKKG